MDKDNSINLCNEEYFNIQQNLSNTNLDFSVNIAIGSNINGIDIFNSPKKCRNSMDLEISYTDEQYFENSNMFEVADQVSEEPCIIILILFF